MSKSVLYVKDGCPYCEKMKNELDQKGIGYEEKNVSSDRQALQEAKQKYGADKVPVLVAGDEVTIGYKGRQG